MSNIKLSSLIKINEDVNIKIQESGLNRNIELDKNKILGFYNKSENKDLINSHVNDSISKIKIILNSIKDLSEEDFATYREILAYWLTSGDKL